MSGLGTAILRARRILGGLIWKFAVDCQSSIVLIPTRCPQPAGGATAFSERRRPDYFLSWRAVDQDGDVLDILVQSRASAAAARRFFRKLLKGLQYVPRVIVTDKLKSYAAASA